MQHDNMRPGYFDMFKSPVTPERRPYTVFIAFKQWRQQCCENALEFGNAVKITYNAMRQH